MAKEITGNRRRRIVIQEQYDVEEDYAVPHSGVSAEDSGIGRPIYDKVIAGGCIIAFNPDKRKTPKHVNSQGHEIDPGTGSFKAPAKVLAEANSPSPEI